MAKAKAKAPPNSGADYKPANKLRRQLLHVKRKRAKDEARRKVRFGQKKEEAKDPSLRAERLRKNIPLTLERKRVWDEADSDVEEGGLGLSVDVERIKRQRKEEEDELNRPLSKEDQSSGGEEYEEEDEDDRDEVDSMIATSDEEDEDRENDEEDTDTKDRGRRRSSLPTATERATSPSQSTRSTNLNLAPEALAAKFPSLFSNEVPPAPKILVTTSIHSTLHHEAELLTSLFPNSVYIRRTAHHHSYKFSLREICSFASNRNYTAVVVLQEDQKRPSGLTIVHLPQGPTFTFSISNWVEGRKLPGHGNPTAGSLDSLIDSS
jgi:ribosome production factor 1